MEHSGFLVELGLLFDAVPDLFFRIDGQGTILNLISGDTSELYLRPEEFLGATMRNCLPGDQGERFHAAIERVMQTGRLASLEYHLPVRGQEQLYEARVFPFDDTSCVALIRNITRLRQA